MDSSSPARRRADEAAAKVRAVIDRREIENAPIALVMAFSKVSRAINNRSQLTDEELDRLSDQADAALADVQRWLADPAKNDPPAPLPAPTAEDYAPFDPVEARNRLDDEDFNAEAAFDEFLRLGSTDRRCLRCGGAFTFVNGRSGYSITCNNGDYRQTVRGI
jgi:hypothetical protein